ncbi:MAG: aminotransferase class V-fold PLP-dependent enzyme [Nocardioidaceae bacterium]
MRWADFDRDTAELPIEAVTAVLSPRTRLVAVTGASNLLGTRPDLEAHRGARRTPVGALVYVDGVHLTPHAPVDVAAIGADFYACSPYKFFGPHLGVLVADPTAAGGAPPRQAAARDRRGARAVRARDAALRVARRGDGHG